MGFDPFTFISKIEHKSPRLAHYATMVMLGQISPFNRHLRARLLSWTDQECTIFVKRRRRVQNHVGSIHAGALFTLGETCAGLVIIRNFPFKNFRPLMSDVRVTYSKQARGDVRGTCTVTTDVLKDMHLQLQAGEIPTVEMITNIYNQDGETLAIITTSWQVKPWQLVRINNAHTK